MKTIEELKTLKKKTHPELSTNEIEEAGTRILELINVYGSIAVFAKETGINYQTITNWVSRKKNLPTFKQIMLIKKATDIDLNWLIEGAKNER